MTIAGEGVVNLMIEMIGIMVSLFSILMLGFGFSRDRMTVRYFFFCFTYLLFYNVNILMLELMNGYRGDGWRIGMLVAGFLSFFMSVVTAHTVSNYLVYVLKPPVRLRRLIKGFLLCVLVLGTAAMLYGQFTGRLALVDAEYKYYEGDWQILGFALVALYLFFDVLLLIRFQDKVSKTQAKVFGVYLGLPLAAIFLRPLLPGVYLVALASSATMLIMFVMTVIGQTQEYKDKQEKNEQMKVDLMLSQIQPHFLFNALYVIQEICRTDPETAYSAIGEFSKYLRHNMDSININVPIPFTEELEHTKHYVRLQQLRFGNVLDVQYDLECTQFRLPTLTLQPIVENAIRYGVRQKEDGAGTVMVRTTEEPDAYVISVSDNGPGFVPDQVPKDGFAHVGLENVRERLRRISGGSLVIDSRIGEGTDVTISLPKE